jgi:polysaccharide deacetylase 2 family uncharacterized protein YibQ
VPRKRRSPQTSRRSLAKVFIPVSLLIVLVAAGLLLRERLTEFWLTATEPELSLPPRGLRPAVELEEAIVLGARELGVPRGRIGRRLGADGQPRFEFRCPDRLHPLTANRWLSRIFADAGIEVLDCSEDGPLGRPRLEFKLAAGSRREARAALTLLPPLGEAPLQEALPRLAILVDDLGNNYDRISRGVLELDVPLTIAILPGLDHSERIEKDARRRGHAVFLHLPMEPEDYPAEDPGRLAVMTSMSRDSILDLLAQMARGFSRLDGFNNHMGSKASADERVVGAVLDWAAREHLPVVDSYTASGSRIYPLARERQLPALRADLFLDGEEEGELAIMSNLAEAAETARRRGWALVICHPRPETLAALRSMLPRLTDYGLRFVTVPQLIAGLGGSDPTPAPRRPGPG